MCKINVKHHNLIREWSNSYHIIHNILEKLSNYTLFLFSNGEGGGMLYPRRWFRRPDLVKVWLWTNLWTWNLHGWCVLWYCTWLTWMLNLGQSLRMLDESKALDLVKEHVPLNGHNSSTSGQNFNELAWISRLIIPMHFTGLNLSHKFQML